MPTLDFPLSPALLGATPLVYNSEESPLGPTLLGATPPGSNAEEEARIKFFSIMKATWQQSERHRWHHQLEVLGDSNCPYY